MPPLGFGELANIVGWLLLLLAGRDSARTLLVPGNLLHGRENEIINEVLARVGMRLVDPGAGEKAYREGLVRSYGSDCRARPSSLRWPKATAR